jgi:hypothetical protein
MEMVGLISRLVGMIPWPERRCAMGDVTLALLDGKHRVAEQVLGWIDLLLKWASRSFKPAFRA